MTWVWNRRKCHLLQLRLAWFECPCPKNTEFGKSWLQQSLKHLPAFSGLFPNNESACDSVDTAIRTPPLFHVPEGANLEFFACCACWQCGQSEVDSCEWSIYNHHGFWKDPTDQVTCLPARDPLKGSSAKHAIQPRLCCLPNFLLYQDILLAIIS